MRPRPGEGIPAVDRRNQEDEADIELTRRTSVDGASAVHPADQHGSFRRPPRGSDEDDGFIPLEVLGALLDQLPRTTVGFMGNAKGSLYFLEVDVAHAKLPSPVRLHEYVDRKARVIEVDVPPEPGIA